MEKEPKEYCVQGIPLKCHHCGHGRFTAELISLRLPPNLKLLDVVELDKLDQSVESLVCEKCGFVHQFSHGFVAERSDTRRPTECLSCGGTIPSGKTACPKCGWSYEGQKKA